MSLTSVLNIAGSGMAAQSIRLNTTASNIANADSASSSVDETYRARKPWFSVLEKEANAKSLDTNGFMNTDAAMGAGVRVDGIVEKDAPLQARFQPDHPMANDDGYVYYPNVNVVEEMTDMMSATRSFETGVEVLNRVKSMQQSLLRLGES